LLAKVAHNLDYVEHTHKSYELLPPFLNGAVNVIQTDDAATERHFFIWPLWLKQETKKWKDYSAAKP
jgi:hypothetical protein